MSYRFIDPTALLPDKHIEIYPQTTDTQRLNPWDMDIKA